MPTGKANLNLLARSCLLGPAEYVLTLFLAFTQGTIPPPKRTVLLVFTIFEHVPMDKVYDLNDS
jgi:hypothetical protein